MKKTFVWAALWLLCAAGARAGEPLKIKFRSRALLDATVSGYGKDDVQGYYRLEDFRVGFKATYKQYEMKADIGLGGNKLAIKDLLLNYHFGHGVLSFGNAYAPYSMDMLISTADLRFHQSAGSVLAFTDSRKLGVTYHHSLPAWYWAAGLYTHNDINKIGEGQVNAMVSTARGVWRRQWEDGSLLHAGGAFSFRTKPVNTDTPPEGNVGNDGITSMLPAPLVEATVDHLGTELKGVFELLYMRPRFIVQGEYFLNCFNRTRGEAYRPQGGYVQAGILLVGRGFEYDALYGIPGRPSTSRAVELVARFNYTDLNDARAGILGGRESDLSVGVNFYLNEYLGMKLNAGYVFVGDHCRSFYTENLLLAQLRLQYIF